MVHVECRSKRFNSKNFIWSDSCGD